MWGTAAAIWCCGCCPRPCAPTRRWWRGPAAFLTSITTPTCATAPRPYPGIPELLAALKAKGLRLGVVSNKPHEFVTQIIEGYFPGLFDSVAGQQGGCIKPDPSGVKQVIDAFGLHPDQVLYVGDSAVDIETAQNAGTASCGVLWGFRDEAELEEAGAQYIAAHPQDIATLICLPQPGRGLQPRPGPFLPWR